MKKSMNFSHNTAQFNYSNIDSFLKNILPSELQIEITYESDYVTKKPVITIIFNGEGIYSDTAESTGKISCSVPISKSQKNILSVSMTGKLPNDTIIKDGNIIKDTFVKMLSFKINQYSLLDDYDFFRNNIKYKQEDGQYITAKDGFWSNSTLYIEFDTPFELWYNVVSKKNSREVGNWSLDFGVNSIDDLVEKLEDAVKKLK